MSGMKILVFNPHDPYPRYCKIDGTVKSAQDVVNSEIVKMHPLGTDVFLVYNPGAETPNREIDGRVICGTFFICGSIKAATRFRRIPMAQSAYA